MSTGSLWRVAFEVPDAAIPAVLEALEQEGQSVSAFEADDADGLSVERWRVEVVYAPPFDAAGAIGRIRERCAAAGWPDVDPVASELAPDAWLGAASLVYPPIRAGRFVVHPAGTPAAELPEGVRVQIDAGLAFGSGAHPTTQGCLMLLDEALRRTRRPRRILDLGCGTGVLGIAAAKAVPARVVLADNDPVAVRIAQENALINRVGGRVQAVLSEGLRHPLARRRGLFDLVMANILADPLCMMARDVSRVLAPGGAAILSGLIGPQAPRVAATFHAAGLPLRRRLDLGAWATLLVAR